MRGNRGEKEGKEGDRDGDGERRRRGKIQHNPLDST